MKIVVLASGSKGNATYINSNGTNILIDAGTNVTYLKETLNNISVSLSDINYILVTHTHIDHINALKDIIKKYQPFICISEKMYHEISYFHSYSNIIIYNNEIIIDNIQINVFNTSHDTSDSYGFIIDDNITSLVYITDTGYLNSKIFPQISNKNYYIFESNHDVEMLINGKYPKWLQQRILSDKGHLSNDRAGFYLSKVIGDQTKKIVLAHLSEENNCAEIALRTVSEKLIENEAPFTNICCAQQFEMVEVVND